MNSNQYADSSIRVHKRGIRNIQVLCLLIILLWSISPPLMYNTNFRIIVVISTIVWMGIELVQKNSIVWKPTLPVVAAVVYIIYSAILELYFDNNRGLYNHFQVYIFLFWLIIYESHKKRDISQLRVLFWAAIIFLPVWALLTINAYSDFHNISRIMSKTNTVAVEYSDEGVGGFWLVYNAVFMVPILIFLIKNKVALFELFKKRNLKAKKIIVPFLLIINLTVCVYLVLNAGYSIAVIDILIGALVVFVFTRRGHHGKILFFIAVILLVFLSLNFKNEYLEEITPGTMYYSKYKDIVESIRFQESTGAVYNRVERYMRSLNLFVNNPLLGTLSFRSIGKHSAIIDKFAQYGIFIGFIFSYCVLTIPVSYLRKNRRAYGLTLSVLITVILLASLNNVFASLGFFLFIFYPITMDYVQKDIARKTLTTC